MLLGQRYDSNRLLYESVADEVYLHPNGLIEIVGLKSQVMFYPGMFEKLGMDVTVLRGPNNKYKSAVEPFLRKNFSEANKEQLEALLRFLENNARCNCEKQKYRRFSYR